MTQPTNPLLDPVVLAALAEFSQAGAELTATALRYAPASAELGEGIFSLIEGINDIAGCVVRALNYLP
jgi:hypothetical protein